MSVAMNTSNPAMYGFDNFAGNPRPNAARGYPPRQAEDVLASQMAGLGFQDDMRGPARLAGGYGAQQQAAAYTTPPSTASYPTRQPGGPGQASYGYGRPQVPQNAPGPLAAFTALNQKVSTAQQLARLNGWTLDEAVARLGGFSPDEVRMLQAAASNNGAAGMQQVQFAQQQALAAREEQLRHLQALQAQLVQQQSQNMSMQLPPPGSYGAQTLYQDNAARFNGQPNGAGEVASAYEQRQAAKQQLEANLKARSGSRPPAHIDLPPRNMQTGPLSPPWPPVPRTHTSSPARSESSVKPATSPTVSTASSRFESAPSRAKDTSSAPNKSSPKSSLGPGTARSESFGINHKDGKDRNPLTRKTSPTNDMRPTLGGGGSAVTATLLPPVHTGSPALVGFSIVMRQPRGPPAGADELGDANFASRIRQKASINLSSALSRRTEVAVA